MKNFSSIPKRLALSVLVLFAVVATAAAQSKKLSIQGFLKDADGKAVENGRYELTFKVYDVASGGTALWTETHPQAVVSGGVYSIQLGSITAIDGLLFDKPYFVGVTVQGSELSPRTELTYAPYALAVNQAITAITAQKAQEVVCSGAVGDIKHSILNPTEFAQVNGACWVPMDGRSITGSKLAQATGRTTIPNGGGLFIRSQEFQNSPNFDEDRDFNTAVPSFQTEGIRGHTHTGSTNTTGSHAHQITFRFNTDPIGVSSMSGHVPSGYNPQRNTANVKIGAEDRLDNSTTKDFDTGTNGSHNHSFTTDSNGGTETRPDNLNFWVYIRIN